MRDMFLQLLKNKQMKKSLFLAFIILSISNFLGKAQYYVAISGDDDNDGLSLGTPFRNIQTAANKMKEGDVCYIREGTYRESIKVKSSGKESAPLKFIAYNNEQVIISGADTVSDWVHHAGNTYKAKLNYITDEVYRNDSMLIPARWPNLGSKDPLKPVFSYMDGGTDGTGGEVHHTIVDADLSGMASDLKGAKIWFMSYIHWWSRTGSVDSISGTNLYITVPENHLWWGLIPRKNGSYYLYNSLDLLDTSNEWYQDPSDSVLYVYSVNGNPPENMLAKHRKWAIDASSKDFVQFYGISTSAAGINLDSSNHCTLDGLTCKNVCSFYEIEFPLSREDTGFIMTENTPGVGILITGSGNIMRNSSVEYSWGDGISLGGINNKVFNCKVNDVNYIGNTPSAISPAGSKLEIEYCTIFRTGRSGIRFRADSSKFSHNHIYDIGYINWDLGGFYSNEEKGKYSLGTEISYNLIHDIQTNESTGPGTNYGGNGIFLDNNTCGILVHHNQIWNFTAGGIALNWKNINIDIFHNTIIGKAMARYANGYDMENVRVYNNFATKGSWIGTDKQHNIIHDTSSFVDAVNNDYRLKAGSPAIDSGLVIPTTDFSYHGEAPDVGALERTGSLSPNPDNVMLDTFFVSDGTMMPFFDSDTSLYRVNLPPGTLLIPEIIAIPKNKNARMEIMEPQNLKGDQVERVGTITVFAENLINVRTYKLIFDVQLSSNAKLDTLYIDQGNLFPLFHPDSLHYAVQLPEGSTDVPTVSAERSDTNAFISIIQASNIIGSKQDRTAKVEVISEDKSDTINYDILFSVEVVNSTAGMEDIETIIYPNPGENTIHVQANSNIEQITILSLQGKILLQKSVNMPSCQLEVSSLNQGVYFVEIVFMNGNHSIKKWVK